MAELAATVVSLAAFGIQLTEILHKYASSVKDAKGRINAILYDTRLTTSVLQQFESHLKEESEVSMSAEARNIALDAIKRCNTVFEDIYVIITGKKRPDPTVAVESVTKIPLLKQLSWPFVEPKLELLRSNLERVKAALQLLMSLLTWGVVRKL